MKRQRQRRDLLAIAWVIAALFGSGAHGQCEVAQLLGSGDPGNDFGRSVSINQEVAVVGDPGQFPGVGAANIFRYDGTSWVEEVELSAPEPEVEDAFGFSVALSGDLLVVGSYRAGPVNAGAAYIFRYDPRAMEWAYEATLTASDRGASTFGWSVSINGDAILVGARGSEVDGLPGAGAAYVFRYDVGGTGEWVEEARLIDPEPEEIDLFGQSVSIRGDVALVGAHRNNQIRGSAFVFRQNPDVPGEWFFETEFRSDGVGQDWFGFSVALADGVAIVGAHEDSSNDKGSGHGSAYIYRHNGLVWVQEQHLTASDADAQDSFGKAVSINEHGDTVVVGANNDENQGFESGSAYVFRYTKGTWQEVTKLTSSDGGPSDKFGISVSVSEDLALIGATRGSSNPGAAYVFVGMSGLDCNKNGEPDACDIFGGTSNDEDGNGIPDECEPILGDIDGDGTVGAADLLILLVNWGRCGDCDDCPADLDGNCTVGASDLLILLANWG
ncbi:MAG: hypothetical protein V3T84_07155 [Phycisphaerales bacterium]